MKIANDNKKQFSGTQRGKTAATVAAAVAAAAAAVATADD